MTMHTNYFYGNEVSEYGKSNGYVDYATFAKAFNHVLANDLMSVTSEIGYWEPYGNSEYYYEDGEGNRYTASERDERIEELNDEKEDLLSKLAEFYEEDFEGNLVDPELVKEEVGMSESEIRSRIDAIDSEIDYLEEEHYYEVFQWYIIDGSGAEICEEAGEIVYYNEALDIYLWGVTHWGTSWDYVLTDIKIIKEER